MKCTGRKLISTENWLSLGERQAGIGVERCVCEDSCAKPGICRGGDHRGVVGRKRAAGEKHFDASGLRALFKRGAQLRIRGDATGNENAFRRELLRGAQGALDQIAHDSVLKFTHQTKALRAAKWQQLLEFPFAAL